LKRSKVLGTNTEGTEGCEKPKFRRQSGHEVRERTPVGGKEGDSL